MTNKLNDGTSAGTVELINYFRFQQVVFTNLHILLTQRVNSSGDETGITRAN